MIPLRDEVSFTHIFRLSGKSYIFHFKVQILFCNFCTHLSEKVCKVYEILPLTEKREGRMSFVHRERHIIRWKKASRIAGWKRFFETESSTCATIYFKFTVQLCWCHLKNNQILPESMLENMLGFWKKRYMKCTRWNLYFVWYPSQKKFPILSSRLTNKK